MIKPLDIDLLHCLFLVIQVSFPLFQPFSLFFCSFFHFEIFLSIPSRNGYLSIAIHPPIQSSNTHVCTFHLAKCDFDHTISMPLLKMR